MSLALEQIVHPALCEYVNMYSNRLNILSSWSLWVSLVVLCPALYYVKAHNLPLGYLSFFPMDLYSLSRASPLTYRPLNSLCSYT
jgi:hypothetical protein